ncbi:class I SAM-dependent methyltransferase [Enterovirga sp. CN4-39]|uniref:class I SAM-dependent methyltransferase n=1 Tax=Enterovirga sp. CN4-39 TaxID=3400910 RepID=UPI003BFEF580
MTPLEREIRSIIAAEGPITVERFMALALGHPRFGYYPTRDPLGAAGDFTTSPEISQMFGELLGLWAAETWSLMGRPPRVALVELGPGRGTLMADALRAARAMPGFPDALAIHLVETSPALRSAQERTLARSGHPVAWHDRFETVPEGPAIILANEFFDALPVRQFVRAERGWHERLVGLAQDDALAFGLAPDPDARIRIPGNAGEVIEINEPALAIVGQLAGRLSRDGGAALVIDYGHLRTAPGDTLQAVRSHQFADPLADPGEADLTAHVDFEALARICTQAGTRLHGPTTQGEFLRTLGIEARANQLKRRASPGQAAAIDAASRRLTDPTQMGTLFKVMAFSHPGLPSVPGLIPVPAKAQSGSELETTC